MDKEVVIGADGKCRVSFAFQLQGTLLSSELELQKKLNEAGAGCTGEILEYFDTNGEPVEVLGQKLTSKGKVPADYQTPYGQVTVSRHVYQTSKGGETHCPLEQNQRILRSATPLFAKQLCHKYAEFGANRVCDDLKDNHGRTIAQSFVQNIAEDVAARAQITEKSLDFNLPKLKKKVASVAASLDGASVLTKDEGWKQTFGGKCEFV